MTFNLNRGLIGETPLDDISSLRPRHVQTVVALADVEFLNITKAVNKYLARRPTPRIAPFTREWMVKVHREMLGEVWTWAGKLRQKDGYNVGIEAYRIASEIEQLAQDIAYWRDHEGDCVEQSVRIHHRAVWIHPFHNGNGRWARLLAQIWECQQCGHYAHWPEGDIWEDKSAIRGEYIQALKQADDGDLDPLIALHRQFR